MTTKPETMNEAFATFESTLKSGFGQWQSAAEAWNRMAVEAMHANLESAAVLREQMGAALLDGTKRAGEIAAREQSQALAAFEAMQVAAREGFERFAAAGRTAAETGRVLFDEAVKTAEEQAKVAQKQARAAQDRAAEWADQGIEALTSAPKAAKK